jgi:hypothetical protein
MLGFLDEITQTLGDTTTTFRTAPTPAGPSFQDAIDWARLLIAAPL